ncbi:hypothetical protein Ddye_016819 [Dipteronia dyeriana]|uniref:Uncharacterized protein n=1 Tax=Dipteronia dyeriana TaxID=168575 RepID=A0AAD9U8E0_9ROSI|nr:hypothetical protein Ddye_016819 [Dipteronia dyeriana]
MFEAEPEVWNTLIESKPSAKIWRVSGIQNYDKLLEQFARDIANGEGAISAKEKVKQWENERYDQFVDLERLEEVTTDNFNLVSPQCISKGANSSKVLKRKASMVDAFDKQVEMIQYGMNNVADAIREGNVIAEKGIVVFEKTRPRIYEEQYIYAELLKIGVPDNLQLEVFLFLVKSY